MNEEKIVLTRIVKYFVIMFISTLLIFLLITINNMSFPALNSNTFTENKLLVKPNSGSGAPFELVKGEEFKRFVSSKNSNIRTSELFLEGESPYNIYNVNGEGILYEFIVYGEFSGTEHLNGEIYPKFKVEKWRSSKILYPPIEFFFDTKILILEFLLLFEGILLIIFSLCVFFNSKFKK